MKPGDKVKLVDEPSVDWMNDYKDKVFELVELYDVHCKVKLHEMPHPEWYWFVEAKNFVKAD